MIIANPIYDVVFKRLMENERVAKFFIGTLLDQTIEAVEAKPRRTNEIKKVPLCEVFWLDFIALIKTAEGERKKVWVEIQKIRKITDLISFQSYLGEPLQPIITIYILDFTLRGMETACIQVDRDRQYYDLINKTVIKRKNYFIESLAPDCYIIQTGRISDRYQTRLDKLLSIFEQTHFTDDTRIVKQYKHEPDEEEVKLMIDILHRNGTEPDEHKQIENEREFWRTINVQLADIVEKTTKVMREKEKKFEELDKEIEEKDKVIEETTKALEEQAKEIEALKRRLNMK
jgi:hypothetical protein